MSAFSVATGEQPVGRYVVIEVSSELTNVTNISWVWIKMQYNETALTAAGLDESTVGIAWYNDASGAWEMLITGTQPWVIQAPIRNLAENWVAANVSHFSVFRTRCCDNTATNATATISRGTTGRRSSNRYCRDNRSSYLRGAEKEEEVTKAKLMTKQKILKNFWGFAF